MVKNFNVYKLLSAPSLPGASKEQLIKNYTKLILSSESSVYQAAPIVPDDSLKKSQKTSHSTSNNDLGITRKQANTIKALVEATVLKGS